MVDTGIGRDIIKDINFDADGFKYDGNDVYFSDIEVLSNGDLKVHAFVIATHEDGDVSIDLYNCEVDRSGKVSNSSYDPSGKTMSDKEGRDQAKGKGVLLKDL